MCDWLAGGDRNSFSDRIGRHRARSHPCFVLVGRKALWTLIKDDVDIFQRAVLRLDPAMAHDEQSDNMYASVHKPETAADLIVQDRRRRRPEQDGPLKNNASERKSL